MAILRADMTRKFGYAGNLIRRYFVVGIFACLAAVSALAQSEAVTVTLLPSNTNTTDPDPKTKTYLSVTASNIKNVKESQSWLYFDAGALPADVQDKDFTNVQLRLVPNAQLQDKLEKGAATGRTGMAITVALRKQKAPSDHTQPLSYDPPALHERITLVSPPLPTDPDLLESRSDSVTLPTTSLLHSEGGRRYIGLVLLPQPNASRRVYYGLNADDITNHPGRLPRLIITYNRKSPRFTACASEPSRLALIQSDGRLADSSSCPFMPNPTSSAYVLLPVAANSLTKTPVVYGDRLYVVLKEGSETRLEELSPLGGLIASVPLTSEVRQGSPMVVDRFGRLRIITNTAILTAQLGPAPDLSPAGRELPGSVAVKSFTFGDVPKIVVPGPDGTLYIAKQGTAAQGIFALNPEVGELDASDKVVHPEKLWEVATADENTTKITLSPDGHFLYALARFTGGKSRFIAINAQTGVDFQLLPGKVNASDFPDNLNTFRNPVVAEGLNGVDFVSITGNSGSGATLWGVRNDPVTQNKDFVARLSPVWKYPLESNSDVGQPILDPTTPPENKRLSLKQLDFLKLKEGPAGSPKLIAVGALKGNKVYETPEPPALPGQMSTEGNPVVDSAGNVFLWANNILYGFTADTKSLFTAPVASSPLELLFGPGGTLYAVSGTTISALVPSFTLSADSPTDICSPTHLQVMGTATKGSQPRTLRARGSVILGNGFVVRSGAQLKVTVGVSKCE
jgi:hypothetical protein